MIKKEMIVIGFVFLLVISFGSFFVSGESQSQSLKAVSDGDFVYAFSNNKLYGVEDGEIIWEYYDESQIKGLDLIKWNSDDKKDLVLFNKNKISPQVKIFDGESGEILDSFRITENSYVGNIFVDVESMKVIDKTIFLSSGSLLYMIKKGEGAKRIFVERFLSGSVLEEDDGKLKVISYSVNYFFDLGGNFLNKNKNDQSFSEVFSQLSYFVRPTNCPFDKIEYDVERHSVDNLKVTGIEKNPNLISCRGDYVYYLNESNYLFKRNFNTESDTKLWQIKCDESSPNVFGESVFCGNNLFVKQGKKVAFPSTEESFLYFYDGQKELVVENYWPFKYSYGRIKRDFSDDTRLNETSIQDISLGKNYFGNGNKEVLIYFGNERGTKFLLVLELISGKKQLLTFFLTEDEIQDKKDFLQTKIDNLNDSLDDISDDISDAQDDLNTENARTGEDRDEDKINSLNSEIQSLENQMNEVQERFYKSQNELSQFNSNSNQGAFINSFDVCDKKLFATSQGGSFGYIEGGKNITEIEIDSEYLHSLSIVCLDKVSNTQRLMAIGSQGDKLKSYIIDDSGSIISQKNIGDNETLISYNQAKNLREKNNIYFVARVLSFDGSPEKYNLYKYDFDGDKIDKKEIGIQAQGRIKNGKRILIGFGGEQDDSCKTFLIDDGLLVFNGICQERDMIIGDCEDGEKLGLYTMSYGVSQGGGGKSQPTNELEFKCLSNGDTLSGYLQEINGRIVGDYFIMESFSVGRQAEEKISFSYEVYTLDGEKIIISNRPVFWDGSKFITPEGEEVSQKTLIANKQILENDVTINFEQEGEKVIFVNGKYYDFINSESMILRLTSGEHLVQVYLYDGEKYFYEEIKVNVPDLDSISFISFFVLGIFVLIIFLIWRGKLSNV